MITNINNFFFTFWWWKNYIKLVNALLHKKVKGVRIQHGDKHSSSRDSISHSEKFWIAKKGSDSLELFLFCIVQQMPTVLYGPICQCWNKKYILFWAQKDYMWL